MGMMATRLGYFNSGATAGVQIKVGATGFYGVVSTITGGAVTVYDGTSTSGKILFTKTLAVGEVIHFGGLGYAANQGLFLVTSGTVNVMYS